MFTRQVWLSAALLMAVNGCAYGSDHDSDELYSVDGPIYSVTGAMSCAGYAIDARTLITAGHCVGDMELISVGTRRYATVTDLDYGPTWDIDQAWLTLTDESPDFELTFDVGKPKLGGSVRMIRSYGRPELSGEVLLVNERGAYMSISGVPGDSGAPIIDDAGLVVGTAVYLLEFDGQLAVFAVRVY